MGKTVESIVELFTPTMTGRSTEVKIVSSTIWRLCSNPVSTETWWAKLELRLPLLRSFASGTALRVTIKTCSPFNTLESSRILFSPCYSSHWFPLLWPRRVSVYCSVSVNLFLHDTILTTFLLNQMPHSHPFWLYT